MKFLFSICLTFSLYFQINAQNLYFPPTTSNLWDTVSLSELGWCDNQLPQLYNYLEQSNTKAFIVLKDGKIAIEKYFDSFTQDSLWYWASAGKTISAFLVGKAQEEGLLNVSDTSSTYLGTGWTSLSALQEEKITIKHQLTMTTGLDDGVPDVDCILPSCLIYKADPGTRWAYHNGAYTLLRSVVEAASGQNINTYLTPRLKTPTGMDGFYFQIGLNSVYISKARSMARFGLLMLNNGIWDGTTVMSDLNYLNSMITPSQTLNNSYGYLWWLNGQSSFMLPGLQIVFPNLLMPNAPSDIYAAMGKNGQILNVSPNQNLVVVRMGNTPDNSLVPNLFNDTIWQKLNAVTCGTNSIGVNSVSESVLLYPNPATKSFQLANLKNNAEIKVYNLEGKCIHQFKTFDSYTSINVSDLPKGLYLVQIHTKNDTQIKKLSIN